MYSASSFEARHFCSFQDPPCSSNECRVATHIIAGLYPLNFSKFLIKAYQPLNEDERKELMNIQKLYFTYLMQKLCDDSSKKIDPLRQMDLLWNIDDTDYTLFCDIGSAFAECYLIDVPIPVQELLDSCFLVVNNDIELNMYWLECVYIVKEGDNSPLKKIENNPKVLEWQLRMQMDQISFNKARLSGQSSRLMSDSTEDNEDEEQTTSTPPTPSNIVNELKANDSMDMVVECKNEIEAIANITVNQIIPSTSPKLVQSTKTPSLCTDTKCKKHDLCDLDSLTEQDATLVDAVKIAVKQKLNQ